MDDQSGFDRGRTDLSAKLTATSKLPRIPEKTRRQRRYDTRHYNQQNSYKLRTAQKNLQSKRDYHNRW